MSHTVVLGRNYLTTLGVIRSLGKKGHIVDVIYNAFRQDGQLVSSSKYVNRYIEIKKYNEDTIISELKKLGSDEYRKVIFFTDDHISELVDRHRNELEKYYYIPGSAVGVPLKNLMDKQFQMDLAGKCGLKTAKSWIIDLKGEIPNIPKDMVYPCFTKPLVSADGSKGDLGSCDDEKQLNSKIQHLKKNGRSLLLVQEYLNIEKEIVLNGVCNDGEVIIPGIIQKTKVAKKNMGVTLSGVMKNTDIISEKVLESIIKMMKELHYKGIFDLELIVTKEDIYFGEINLRCGGPCYIYTYCKANLPDIAVSVFEKNKAEYTGTIDEEKSFVNDKVLWEDYLGDYISIKEFNSIRKSVDYSLTNDPDDKTPGNKYNYMMLKKRVKKILKLR